MSSPLEPTRLESREQFFVTGLNAHYNMQTRHQIPDQWSRFCHFLGKVPGQVGTSTYGVCWACDDLGEFDYLCGVEVDSRAEPENGLEKLPLASQLYAVFTHSMHYSQLPETFRAIWGAWFPSSDYEPVQAPVFERYTEEFNPETGIGGIEVWVPVKKKSENE